MKMQEMTMFTGLVLLFTATSVCLGHAIFPLSEHCTAHDHEEHLAESNGEPLSTSEFRFYDNLIQGVYELRWNFNSTHIVFQTRVRTNGYIGLGISQSGGMFPSDLVVGWVKNGQSYFVDRHTESYAAETDEVQDWTLVSGTEEGEYTTLVIMRPLDTCDGQDLPITSGHLHVIYSFNQRDPLSAQTIMYHGRNRGSKSLILLVGV